MQAIVSVKPKELVLMSMSNHTTETNRGLTDIELDEVSGGEGYEVDGVLRAVTQWFHDNTFGHGISYEIWKDLSCPKS